MKFGVIGVDHGHINGMVTGLLDQDAECGGVFGGDDEDRCAAFAAAFPHIPSVDDPRRLLDDPSIELIVTAGVPADRAGIAVQAMRHGKDVLTDKAGCITLEQLAELRHTVAETGRIWAVYFGVRFSGRAVQRARQLIDAGAIGTVVHTLGLGPHRLNKGNRQAWFFDPARNGGIITDIASHQVDQFLYLTGSDTAEVVTAAIGNFANPDVPEWDDFGELLLRSPHARGYARVDWYTPDGLSGWGDSRTTILGTEGYIELRKAVDPAGRPGGNHLFLIDNDGEHYIDCSKQPLPFYSDLVRDIRDRTETANPQHLYFTATELAITAQQKAEKVGTA